jgi:hypothetical protein
MNQCIGLTGLVEPEDAVKALLQLVKEQAAIQSA